MEFDFLVVINPGEERRPEQPGGSQAQSKGQTKHLYFPTPLPGHYTLPPCRPIRLPWKGSSAENPNERMQAWMWQPGRILLASPAELQAPGLSKAVEGLHLDWLLSAPP